MALAHSPKIITDGLVLCLDAGNPKSYPGSGTTWTDLSGNGNNGTLTNGVGYNSSNGGSFTFDGTNDFIKRTTVSGDSLDIKNTISSSIWFNATTLPVGDISTNIAYLLSKNLNAGTVNQQYSVALNETNISVSVDGAGKTISYTFNTNNWYNIITTYDSATINVYINGSSIYSSSLVASNFTFKPNLSIGRRSNASDGSAGIYFFDGNIAQVSIYNRALTASEIQQNFNALRGRFGI